jgi:outer membrane protein
MKATHNVLSMLVLLTLVFGTSNLWAAAAGKDNFAYVDVAKVFDEYQKTKDNDRTLQEAGKKKEQDRDALVHAVRQIKDEIVLLNEESKAKKQEEMDAKVKELQEFDSKAKRELGEQRSTIVREIFKDIDDTVKRLGERKGFDVIFNERAMLFHNPKYDVTTEVLTELNKDYASKKK